MSKSSSVTILENPTIEQATEFIKNAVSEHKAVILVGKCWVNYKGRASSKLEPGERIVIIKEDGSVLVHRPNGYVPVNWQPAGCTFQVRTKDEAVRIRATRRKPLESLSVHFDVIFSVSAMKLVDHGEFSLHASESDMQKAILVDPSLLEEGFELISYEKKVDPGFVDVYGLDKNGTLVVVELKRKTAGRDAALQLSKYVDCIKNITNRELRGILVAPSLAKGVQTILTRLGLEYKSLDPKTCADTLQKSATKKLEDFFE
ncbi:MAG: endonuclease NucS [Candidatus Bathyarchaeota archaeon]|nr:endonuclease NucS [Candidatus Bathyarchaeum tardum]WNZ29036.1 MAG: endonuclease NucS [Candidatus Bathyarchaeota archaeon]